MAAGNLSLQPLGFQGGEPETSRSQPQHTPAELARQSRSALLLAGTWSPRSPAEVASRAGQGWTEERWVPGSARWPCSLTRPWKEAHDTCPGPKAMAWARENTERRVCEPALAGLGLLLWVLQDRSQGGARGEPGAGGLQDRTPSA